MQISHDFERYAAIAALVLLVVGCYLVVQPFLTAFLWAGIIAVSTAGFYARLAGRLGGRNGLAALLTTLGLASTLLLPIATLGLTAAAQWPALVDHVRGFMAAGIPQPPAWLGHLPIVGKPSTEYWQTVAADPQRLGTDLLPLLNPVRKFLVAFSAGIGSGLLEFALALLIAGLLYVWGGRLAATLGHVAERLGGPAGRRQLAVVESTVRGVFRGVIGTAAVQASLATFGFLVAGVPGAPLLGMATFFLSLVPGGPTLLWLPAAVWLHANGDSGWALFLALWGIFPVGTSDNIIRPLLIGKGVQAPSALIFLGVLGGILAFGFLGLFIGPTVLAVAYNLFQDWIDYPRQAPPAAAGD